MTYDPPCKVLIDTILFFGCGTSYHAGCILQNVYLQYGCFQEVQCFDASHYDPIYKSKSKRICGIFISQSEETMDLLTILESFHERHMTLGITNGIESQLLQFTHESVHLNIGKERVSPLSNHLVPKSSQV